MHLSDGARFPSFAIAALSAGVPTLARATEINRELLEGAAALFANDHEVRDALEEVWTNGRGARSWWRPGVRARSISRRTRRRGLPLAVPRGRARLDVVKRTITISIEQLSRPQPGGIATYVRAWRRGCTTWPIRRSTSSASGPRGHGR